MPSGITARLEALAAILAIALSWCAPACGGDAALVTGDRTGGWFVAPFLEQGGMLFFLPAGGPPGALVSAMPLAAAPGAMASLDGRLVMVFDPVRTDPDKSTRLRQVREVRATPGPRPPMHFFSELSPLPPLEDGGALEALAVTREGVLAALGPAQLSDRRRFLELTGTGWTEVAIPAGLDLSWPFHLLALDGAAVVAQSKPGAASSMWVRDQAEAPGGVPGWRKAGLGEVPTGARLIGAQGQLLALDGVGSADGRLLLARAERWFEIGTAGETSGRQWIAPVGNTITIVTSALEEPTRFACRVLSPTGEVIYEGPAQTIGPVGRRELEVLGLLLASLLLTIAVFVFRPAGAERVSVALPPGFALADPWKRLIATTIDAALAVVLASLIWGAPLRAIVDLALAVTGDHGVWPLVTAGGILMVMSAIGEATTGRTVGKWLVGCRTVGSDGANPGWGQSLARNAVKTLCPPLAAVSLNVPGQQTPASFGTFVIARTGGASSSDSGEAGPDGSSGSST